MKSITTLQREYLKSQGAEGISLHQLLYNYMYSKSTNTYKQYNMLLDSLLSANGYSKGSIGTKLYNYLTDLGHTQKSINSKIVSFLSSDGPTPPVGCAFPFDNSITAFLPGSLPLVVSGADSQTISTPETITNGAIYLAGTNVDTPIVLDWPADELRIVERIPLSTLKHDPSGTTFQLLHGGGVAALPSGDAVYVFLRMNEGLGTWEAVLRGSVPGRAFEGGVLVFSELPEYISIGVSGAGHVYCIAEGESRRILESGGGAPWSIDGLFILLEMLDAGGDFDYVSGISSVQVVTDASQFQTTYPAIPGITKLADLCGNPVQIHQKFVPFCTTPGYVEIDPEYGVTMIGYASPDFFPPDGLGQLENQPAPGETMVALFTQQADSEIYSGAIFLGDMASFFQGTSLYINGIEYEYREAMTGGGGTTIAFNDTLPLVDGVKICAEFGPATSEWRTFTIYSGSYSSEEGEFFGYWAGEAGNIDRQPNAFYPLVSIGGIWGPGAVLVSQGLVFRGDVRDELAGKYLHHITRDLEIDITGISFQVTPEYPEGISVVELPLDVSILPDSTDAVFEFRPAP